MTDDYPRNPVHIHVGVLGWGNRKSGLEAYGSGGRWHGRGVGVDDTDTGDLLGDALAREGCHEGAALVVVAVQRRSKHDLPTVEAAVRKAVEALDFQ
jgi:hypothetical protein